MIVNVKKFNNFIKKATLNYTINTFSCDIDESNVVSKMIKPSSDAIVCLNFKNDIFIDNKETLTFNFIEPNASVVPYLNLIESDEADLIVRDEKLILKSGKQKSNLFFCEEMIPSKFGAQEPKGQFKPFITIKIDDEFMDSFSKLKKIGNKFGKVYFNVKDGVFQMETTDKKNKFSNGILFDISETSKDVKDLSMCVDYSNFVNMFSVLDSEVSYTMSFIYVREKNMGLLSCSRENEESENIERYYLMSKMEI